MGLQVIIQVMPYIISQLIRYNLAFLVHRYAIWVPSMTSASRTYQRSLFPSLSPSLSLCSATAPYAVGSRVFTLETVSCQQWCIAVHDDLSV